MATDGSSFKTAFKFLQDHDQICRDRVGIVGFSYGGYLTLRTATLPEVKPSCLICINGPVGSTVPLTDDEGRAEDFNFHQKHWKFNDNGHVIFKDVSLPANLPPSHIVKMEKIPCPVLYIASGDDLNAYPAENADLMTECTRHTSQSRAVPKTERSIEHDLFPLVNRDDKLEQTLNACGKGHLFTRLSYPGAGHLVEPPFTPNARMGLWSVKPKKLFTLWGGQPAPHAVAQEDAWRKVHQFMETHLRGDRG